MTPSGRIEGSLFACLMALSAAAGGCRDDMPASGRDGATEHPTSHSGGAGPGGARAGSGGGSASGGGGGQVDAGPSDADPICEPGAPVGTKRPAGDGCNTCICSVGTFWACTTAFCNFDASVSVDVPPATGGRSATGGAGGGGGSGGRGGGGGSGGGAAGGRSSCVAAEMLDRSCTSDGECVAVQHVTDCCGSKRVMGLRATGQGRFQELESQCSASYPACQCPPLPTMTDDGSGVKTGSNVAIGCVANVCTTFHPGCARPCTGGRVCATCASGPSTYAACTTSCDGAACNDAALPLCQAAFSGDRKGKYCTATGIACGTP